jgi:hypothetical protein
MHLKFNIANVQTSVVRVNNVRFISAFHNETYLHFMQMYNIHLYLCKYKCRM